MRPFEGEDIFSEEATVPAGTSVGEPDLEKSCDEVHFQAVIEDLPPKLDMDQRTAPSKFIRDRTEMFSKSDYDIG